MITCKIIYILISKKYIVYIGQEKALVSTREHLVVLFRAATTAVWSFTNISKALTV